MKILNRAKAIGDFLYIYKYQQTFVNDCKYLYRIPWYIYELYAILQPNQELMKKTVIILLISTLLTNCKGDDYFNLGVFQEKNEKYEKSIYYYTKAIEDNINDNEAYFNRAHCQQKIGGKQLNVIADYSKSIELNPNDNEAYMNRGVAYMEIKQYSKAIIDYKKSIEIKSDYALVYANLGNVYKLGNDIENACLNWKISLNLGNQNVKQRIELNCK